MLKDVICNVSSVTPYSASTTVTLPPSIYNSSTTTAKATKQSHIRPTPSIYKSSTTTAGAKNQSLMEPTSKAGG